METEEELEKLKGFCTEKQICFTGLSPPKCPVPTSTRPSSADPTNTQILQGKTLGKTHTGKNSNNSNNKPVIHSRELLGITVRSSAETKRSLLGKIPVPSHEKEAESFGTFLLLKKKKIKNFKNLSKQILQSLS